MPVGQCEVVRNKWTKCTLMSLNKLIIEYMTVMSRFLYMLVIIAFDAHCSLKFVRKYFYGKCAFSPT